MPSIQHSGGLPVEPADRSFGATLVDKRFSAQGVEGSLARLSGQSVPSDLERTTEDEQRVFPEPAKTATPVPQVWALDG